MKWTKIFIRICVKQIDPAYHECGLAKILISLKLKKITLIHQLSNEIEKHAKEQKRYICPVGYFKQ